MVKMKFLRSVPDCRNFVPPAAARRASAAFLSAARGAVSVTVPLPYFTKTTKMLMRNTDKPLDTNMVLILSSGISLPVRLSRRDSGARATASAASR